MLESAASSSIYSNNKLGRAIWINNKAGASVQTHSTNCTSKNSLLINLELIIVIITISTNLIIKSRIRLIKSWRKVNSSIRGDNESENLSWDHVPMFN